MPSDLSIQGSVIGSRGEFNKNLFGAPEIFRGCLRSFILKVDEVRKIKKREKGISRQIKKIADSFLVRLLCSEKIGEMESITGLRFKPCNERNYSTVFNMLLLAFNAASLDSLNCLLNPMSVFSSISSSLTCFLTNALKSSESMFFSTSFRSFTI